MKVKVNVNELVKVFSLAWDGCSRQASVLRRIIYISGHDASMDGRMGWMRQPGSIGKLVSISVNNTFC